MTAPAADEYPAQWVLRAGVSKAELFRRILAIGKGILLWEHEHRLSVVELVQFLALRETGVRDVRMFAALLEDEPALVRAIQEESLSSRQLSDVEGLLRVCCEEAAAIGKLLASRLQ